MEVNITHPLSEAFSRIGQLDIVADVGMMDGTYFSANRWAHADISYLEQALTKQASDYPNMDKRTQASYFINEYAWYVPLSALASYLLIRRVPDVSRDNMALRSATYQWEEDGESGEAERLDVRYLSGTFACLADDVAATHPDAVVVPDDAALLNWLRVRLEAHMKPIIERVYRLSKLSKNAQWRLVADASAGQLLNLGKKIKQVDRAQAEGLAFVKVNGSPLNNSQTGYITLTCAGHTDTFRERGGCCRYYTVSAEGDYCGTCVLRTPENRKQWFLNHMERTYNSGVKSC
ncbi:MAG: (2Fe-2S)-binding protein [Anaerolineae bacterium]